MNTTPQRMLLTLGTLLLLGIGMTACGASASSQSSEVTKEAAPTVGVPVKDGDIEFVVNSVSCTEEPMSDGTYAPLPPSGQYCKVNVSATALADVGMYLGDITITTANIRGEVKSDGPAMMYAGSLKADYMNEGQTLTGDVVFDIAVDDSVKTVLLKKNAMSTGVTVPVN